MKTYKRNGFNFAEITKNGKREIAITGLVNSALGQSKPLFHFESLWDAGWIRVTHCGDENVYFTFTDDNGEEFEGMCKCL